MAVAVITIAERVWITPRHRATWAEVYSAVRAARGNPSVAVLPEAIVVQGCQQAVHHAWPRQYQRELWKTATIATAPESITLPWQPYYVLDAAYGANPNGMTLGYGQKIPTSLWAVENDQWRWLGPEAYTFGNPTVIALEVIGRPRPIDHETAYCPVELGTMLQLAQIEITGLQMYERGVEPEIVQQAIFTLREQIRQSIPRHRLPPHINRFRVDATTADVFATAGQDNVTLDDLR